MSNFKNKLQLIGYIGKDPDIRQTSNGYSMARISLAVSDSYRNSSGEKIDETNWHSIVLWGHQAEIAEKYLRKGMEIGVEGKLVSRSYENKHGKRVYATEVRVSEIIFLSRRENREAA